MARRLGRVAGLFYVVTIAAGIFAEVGVRGAVSIAGDPTASLVLIEADPAFYRLGALADLVMLGAYLVVTVLLYHLLKPAAPVLAGMAATFSLIGIAVLAVGGVLHLAPLELIDTSDGLAPGERAGLAAFALALHGTLYQVSLAFFGVYCVLVGLLAWRQRTVPLAVSALMGAGGVARLLVILAAIALPSLAQAIPAPLRVLPLIGEGGFALWLAIFGARSAPPVTRPV